MTPYEELRAEPSNTKKEHLDAAEDKVSGNPIDAEIVGAVRNIKKSEVEDLNITSELDTGLGKPLTFVLPQSAVEDDRVDRRTMVNHADEQQTSISQIASELVEVLIEASEQGNPSLKTEHGIGAKCEDSRIEAVRMGLPDNFVAPDDSSMTPLQVTCQRPPGRDVDIFQTVSSNAYGQDPCVQEFGISISNRLANVAAQTLALPRLKYHDTSWEECILSIGHGNMMNKRMVNGGSVRHWACINFSQYVRAEIAPQLCNELIEMCRTSGMIFESNPVLTIQCARPEHCDGDKFQETSNAAGFADEHKESPRLSGISDDIHSTISKSKEIIVGPKATLCDCAVQNEFQNSPTISKNNESSKRCGLLGTVRYEFATGDCKMDPDVITETPSVTLKRNCSLKVEELCTYPSPLITEEPSLRERIAAGSTEEPTCPQGSNQNELERTSQKCSVEKDKEKSCGSDVLETVSCAMLVREVEEDTAVKAPLHQSNIQNELKNYSTTGNKDSESSRVELLGTNPVNIVFGKWMMDAHGRAEQLYSTFKRNSS
ncbi:unnamed protein product [Sphagnum troendelagicum]|uniref:Uncharacterized protein n=1 Tax=Sphagnum troendelagicum TaxID=128251 RepID=A0ABP0TF89_9BRYO